MIKSKKQSLIVIGVFTLVLMLGTVTYAFFNYTRTGSANVIKTGHISFNTEQGQAINLTNMFPIDVTNGIPNDATKVGSVTIHVTGDTSYSEGLEYLVSAVNVQNSVGNKSLPISIDVSYTANNNKTIGTEDEEYFDNVGSNTTSYRVLAKNTVSNNDRLLVGHIAPNVEVDGNIVIRAYLDKARIAISDTYPEGTIRTVKTTGYSSADCHVALTGAGVSSANATTYCATTSDLQDTIDDGSILSDAQVSALVSAGLVEEYTDGTTNTWVGDRAIFTTEEWNALQTNGVSFKVKVESNEGIWVEEIRTVNVMNTFPTVITDEKTNIKEVYFNKMGATRMQSAYDSANIKADLTYNNEGKVLAWLETNQNDNTMYNLIIASDGETYLTTGESLFAGYINAEKIEFNNINTSRVTIMAAMFSNCHSVTKLDLGSFDTSNVVQMNQMFFFLHSASYLDLSSFDTSNVVSGGMSMMFQTASDETLEKIYVSDLWDASSQPSGMPIFGNNYSLVGGNGTPFDSAKTDKSVAIIDGTDNQDGYLTDIADKPAN